MKALTTIGGMLGIAVALAVAIALVLIEISLGVKALGRSESQNRIDGIPFFGMPLFVLALMAMYTQAFNPFLYFQF